MKKIFTLMAAVIASLCMTISANENVIPLEITTSNYTGQNHFFDNWSVGLEGGVQTNLHDWNAPQGGIVGINLNKQLVPAFGISLEGYVGFNNTGNWYSGPRNHVHNLVTADNVQAYLTGRWNLMNSLGGYKGKPRLFEIETTLGFGYGHFFHHSSDDNYGGLLGKAGLNLNFNLGKDRAWTLTLKPAVVWNFTDAPVLYAHDVARNQTAVFQGTAGLVYHFNTSNGTRYIAATPVPALLKTNEALNEKVNALRQQVEELQSRPVETQIIREVVVEKEVTTNTVQSTYVVTFAFDSDALTADAMEVLNTIPTGSTVDVVAYASPEGADAYNNKLSVRRAEAIATVLRNNNVNVRNITGMGVTGKTSNRIGIVTVVK